MNDDLTITDVEPLASATQPSPCEHGDWPLPTFHPADDRLTGLVEELVLTRDQFLDLAREQGETNFAGPIARLDRVTIDLQGEVFRFDCPLEWVAPPTPVEVAMDESAEIQLAVDPRGQLRRVLVVEDSLFFRQLLRAALEADGYQVATAESAALAGELLERIEPFAAILCGIELPGMTGCEFAAACRLRPELHATPLIAMTSQEGYVHRERILAAGFDRVLIKFQPRQLRDTLVELLQRPHGVPNRLCA